MIEENKDTLSGLVKEVENSLPLPTFPETIHPSAMIGVGIKRETLIYFTLSLLSYFYNLEKKLNRQHKKEALILEDAKNGEFELYRYQGSGYSN